MKTHLSLSDGIENLVDAINKFQGDVSAVEPDDKHCGVYREFLEENQPDK